jgi:hypothetical protein
MRRRTMVAGLVAAMLLAGGMSRAAVAEKIVVTTPDGYRCESNRTGLLEKTVCRRPAAPSTDWHVCIFEDRGAPWGILRNCFEASGRVVFNDAPQWRNLYGQDTFNGVDGVVHFVSNDGHSCQMLVQGGVQGLVKTYCVDGGNRMISEGNFWRTCLFEPSPVPRLYFMDCWESTGRRWSQEASLP